MRRSLQAVLPTFVDGIPELGIPSLDPYKVENLHFDLPGGISLEIKEGYTKGLRKCHVESVRYVYPYLRIIKARNYVSGFSLRFYEKITEPI